MEIKRYGIMIKSKNGKFLREFLNDEFNKWMLNLENGDIF